MANFSRLFLRDWKVCAWAAPYNFCLEYSGAWHFPAEASMTLKLGLISRTPLGISPLFCCFPHAAEKAKLDTETEREQPADGASAIVDPSLTAHAASCLKEDLEWRRTLESVTGPASQDSKPPVDREGPLWDVYRKAVSEGFEVDTNTYYTMLRVKIGAPGKTGLLASEWARGKG